MSPELAGLGRNPRLRSGVGACGHARVEHGRSPGVSRPADATRRVARLACGPPGCRRAGSLAPASLTGSPSAGSSARSWPAPAWAPSLPPRWRLRRPGKLAPDSRSGARRLGLRRSRRMGRAHRAQAAQRDGRGPSGCSRPGGRGRGDGTDAGGTVLEIATGTAGPLASEFALTIAEIEAGAGHAEALASLRERTGASELGAVGAALERSRRYGSPLAEQLHAQAATLEPRSSGASKSAPRARRQRSSSSSRWSWCLRRYSRSRRPSSHIRTRCSRPSRQPSP